MRANIVLKIVNIQDELIDSLQLESIEYRMMRNDQMLSQFHRQNDTDSWSRVTVFFTWIQKLDIS